MLETKPFGDRSKARVLVIGHDPRLQRSDTIAEYCFFADYFFGGIPAEKSELKKYELAGSVFSYARWLTSDIYTVDEFILTNLCNKALEHTPKGKIVFIPEECAKEGLETIREILESSRIEIILAMSEQVNYWLQKLQFYSSGDDYLGQSEPKSQAAEQGYYEPVGRSPFLKICGNKYLAEGIALFPVLHVKQYPLKGHIKANYEGACHRCINSIKSLHAKRC